jgi:hypothetical protein
VFMREDRKSFGFNISSVANQRVPTSAALIPCKVESLLRVLSFLGSACSRAFKNQLRREFVLNIQVATLSVPPNEHVLPAPSCIFN